MNNPYIGSSFDEFLEEYGLLSGCDRVDAERVSESIQLGIEQAANGETVYLGSFAEYVPNQTTLDAMNETSIKSYTTLEQMFEALDDD